MSESLKTQPLENGFYGAMWLDMTSQKVTLQESETESDEEAQERDSDGSNLLSYISKLKLKVKKELTEIKKFNNSNEIECE